MLSSKLNRVFTDPEDIPLDGGGLRYYPQYIVEPDQLYDQLRDDVDWQQPALDVYGKRHLTPRLVAFVGDPGIEYRYSGHRHCALPWPAQVRHLREKIAEDTGFDFNCALLNYYRNGDDCMGYHSDDEISLGGAPCIASLSLGCGRDFLMTPKGVKAKSRKIYLASGSLLLMLPPTQRNWQHALPARKGLVQGRINITFRKVILSVEE
ncbi:alpha-ketoglutarate-dependent dioxygenase AlkB [Zhongshania sp.]|uniref:alpha-ketoglutarate-dependent dioxygenase AlkB family protein n=1 Tax=Zhongshania sp. TaxID=1971902 RepID=UPI0035669432